MFIDTIEQQYLDRVLLHIDLDHTGFVTLFEISDNSRLKVDISVHQYNGKLAVFEVAHEQIATGRSAFIDSKEYALEGDASSILPLLKQYLQTAIGNIDEHTYEGSFAGMVLEQFLGKS
jgi:hypothetical protein